VGVREQFGTMTKPFHPGGAARAGLTAALLAKHGFTASPKAIEAPRGIRAGGIRQAELE
jgi:2-methylcitrate dehydratase PrpD